MSAASAAPLAQSWLASANAPGCAFPLQNLPYGVFSTAREPRRRCGVAIGDCIVDLAALAEAGLLGCAPSLFARDTLNGFIAQGRPLWEQVRRELTMLLQAGNEELAANAALRDRALVPAEGARLHLPVEIPGYTDFYSSREHATNVGALFRGPGEALKANWLEMPIAYNGRASSVVVSGTEVRRPAGQIKLPDQERPVFGPCRKLDFELETAFIIGKGNELGKPIPCAQAEEHIFGMVLLNDWSARDIQAWEYVPLGPFNGKSFATTISPWVVPLQALEPFRVGQPPQAPQPLPYLRQQGPHAFDIELSAELRPRPGAPSTLLARGNFRTLYWSMAQQLAHHTASGCNTRVGDLMGSGTISGSTPDSLGSLLEKTRNGAQPFALYGGERRTFLEDGDEVILRASCRGAGYLVGFGACAGRVVPG